MGLLAFVLHMHLPYVRKNGTWPCGEDFFHQAAFDSYVPLAAMLGRLAGDGVAAPLTLGVTPVLAGQMEDHHMLDELAQYLARVELRAWRQAANRTDDDAAVEVGRRDALRARDALTALDLLGDGGIATLLGRAAKEAGAELAGGPAAHALLPRVALPSVLAAHVTAGIDEHTRIFGAAPRTLWLPECGYEPGRSLEDVLEGSGVRCVVVDGRHVNDVTRPTALGGSLAAAPIDRVVTDAVWSPTGGYPAGIWYRDFHHYDDEYGFKTSRITDLQSNVKRPYDEARAHEAAYAHARDFVALLERRFDTFGEKNALIVAAFDGELFGHWWREGLIWLEHVLRSLAGHPSIHAVTLTEALNVRHPRPGEVRGGTWGEGADFRSWLSDETAGMWEAVTEAERRTARLVNADTDATTQLMREMFLLSASDWPYMIVRDQTAGYARERFAAHLDRHGRIAEALERHDPQADEIARAITEVDNPFPNLTGAQNALIRMPMP